MANKGNYKGGNHVIKKFTYTQVYLALKQTNGLRTHAAKLLGCDYHLIGHYIKQSKWLRDKLDEIRNNILDVGENHIIKAINDGNLDIIWKYMKLFGANRGYIEKQIIEMKIDVTKLSDEEIDYAIKTGKLPDTILTPVNSN